MSRALRSIARTCGRSFAALTSAVVLVGVLSTPAYARMEISTNPASGPVGTSITVKGSDYGADTVEILWENDKGEFVLQGEATVDKNRAFTFTFKAPEGKAGNHRVKVRPKGSTNPNNDRYKLFKITTGNRPVEIKAGCTGIDNSPPFEDPFTEEPIDSPSIIPVAATVDGAPEGASFGMEILAPDGQLLPIRSAVDEKGRVAGATPIFTFGLYVATNPIVIAFTDPSTGEKVTVRIDPTTVFPADGLAVGPEEVECNADDLPPGDLLVVTAPPPGDTGSQPPGTGSEPPAQPPEQPTVSSGGGGVPVIWIVVIGGGVVLVLVGGAMVIGSRREEPDLVHPGWDEMIHPGWRDAGPEPPELSPGMLHGDGGGEPPPFDGGQVL